LLAAAGAEPLPPLSPAEAVALTAPTVRRAGFTVVVAAPLGREGGERAVLLMGTPRIEHLHRVSGFIVMLVLLVMVLSAVVAWDISRPLNRLKRQAEAFGAGDLAARTDIRRSDEIGKLAETFNEMGGRIEAMVRREKQLLADISHEIRTPLARIRVAVELCAEEEGSLEAVQRHLAGIDGDLAELETLLGDALTAFRLDVAQRAGPSTYPLASATLALTPLLDAAAERFRRADPTIKLEFRLPADLPPIRGDAILLRRLIENLLDNAVKYGDRSRPVEVEAAIEGEELAVEVADRGPGAPPEDLPHLFDPFFRSTGKGDSNIAGLGLGLTLCRRIVEAHGGTIGARQREGGGLVVRFTLAIAFPEPAG
jgi:signal transduction histidine kinase